MRKSSLLITSEFLNFSAGTPRQINWIGALLKNNYVVSVYDLKFDEIHIIENKEQLNLYYERITRDVSNYAGQRNTKNSKFFRKIKYLFLLDIISFSLLQIKTLKKKIETKNISLVISSSPSPLTLIFGYFLTTQSQKFIIDFRDQWYNHPLLDFSKHPLRKRIEKIICRKANYLITVSDFIATQLKYLHGKKVYTLRNTIVFLENTNKKSRIYEPKGNETNIVSYTGSLPSNIFNHKNTISNINLLLEIDPSIEFWFVGNNNEFQNLCKENKQIIFLSHTSKQTVSDFQKKSKYLLLIGADFPYNGGILTTKLWEYLSTKQPILAFNVLKGGDLDKVLNQFCKKSYFKNSKIPIYTPLTYSPIQAFEEYVELIKKLEIG